MRVWYFSEMAYHPAWEEGLKRGSLRVVLPNANYDPNVGHQLLDRYLDEFRQRARRDCAERTSPPTMSARRSSSPNRSPTRPATIRLPPTSRC